jgi:hypothetical protein
MGFMKGLISLPVNIVKDVATMGGVIDDNGRPHTMDSIDHLTGDDPESRAERELDRLERIKRIIEK